MNPKVRWAIWCETTGKHTLPSQWLWGVRKILMSKAEITTKLNFYPANSSWTYVAKKYPVNRIGNQ